MVLLWIRSESRADEQRTPVTPDDAATLLRAGMAVVVEESPQRCFPIQDYRDRGCTVAAPGSWADAPAAAIIIGLKELPETPVRLSHRHVFFGHAYKGQAGAKELLQRFTAGGGTLLDLEYLTDDRNRRLVAFGHWAGYAGAALAVLHWAGALQAPLRPWLRADLNRELEACGLRLAARNAPKVLVMGAAGRGGAGAAEALRVAGIEPTKWDIEETRILRRRELLAHDILINTVLVTKKSSVFVTQEDVNDPSRRLSLIADVTCDVHSECNALPIYDTLTSWQNPVQHLRPAPAPLDLIAIDNLPSLMPRDSSLDFSSDLTPFLLNFSAHSAPWARCEAHFRQHAGMAATRHEMTDA